MNKKKTVLISVVFVLVVFIAAGGFIINNLLKPQSKDSVMSQSPSEEYNQESTEDSVHDLTALLAEYSDDAEKDKVKYTILKYTVKSGDTLESIASAHNVKVSTIAQSNGISKNDIIQIDQALEFPSMDGLLYKIKSGETLWDLSVTYDVETDYLVEINHMDSPDKLKIGQQLFLPGVENLAVQKEATKVVKDDTSTKVASKESTSSKSSSSSSTTAKSASISGIWPVKGTITSRYGLRWKTQHKGIDIGAPTGTGVYAFMSGKVTYSSWNSGGYGNLIKIDHGNGIETYYGHNSKLLVSEGQYVNKGDQIARVGSTGYSTGPHLHFEVRKNGVPVNPMDYLK